MAVVILLMGDDLGILSAPLGYLFLGLGFMVTFLGCGKIKGNWRVAQARSFVAQSILVLETERLQKHSYPNSLPGQLRANAPSIVEYTSSGKTYMFAYRDPLELFGQYQFRSDAPEWYYASS